MRKVIILAFTLAAMMCLPAAVFADGVVQNDIEVGVSGTVIPGEDVCFKITDESGELIWIDSVAADADGTYSFSAILPVNENNTVYALLVNGTKASEVTVLADSDVLALFGAANTENVTDLIKTYALRLNLDLSDGYGSGEQSAVNSLFLQESFESADEIKDAFCRSVAINKINGADRSSLLEILQDNASYLNIDYERNIEKLNRTQKETFVIEMLNNRYASLDEFSAGFKRALRKAENTEHTQKETSVKSGSSGGNLNVALPKPDVIQNASEKTVSGDVFNDLESVSWAKKHIESLYEKGIVYGRGDGKFSPNDTVTREEFVAMIVRMFGFEKLSDEKFDDVSDDAWYKDAVSAAAGSGIINGVTNTQFGTGSEITRQDCAVICARIYSYFGKNAEASGESFSDDLSIADYARDAVYIMKNLGIISGVDNNRFDPQASCTRAMAAKIIDMLGGLVKA